MDFDTLESDHEYSLSKRSIVLDSTFSDYDSFEGYIRRYEIPVILPGNLQRAKRLGYGAIWTVFQGTHQIRSGNAMTSEAVAIKRLNLAVPQTKSDVAANTLELREQLAIASLEVRALATPVLRNHPNVAKLLGVSWEEVGPLHDPQISYKRPLLVVELASQEHPTLEDLWRTPDIVITEDTKCALLADIAAALTSIHKCGMIHGDVKPGNILIFRDQDTEKLVAKISDFGGCQPSAADEYDPSQITADLEIFPLLGTEFWNAPEVYSESHSHFRAKYRDYYSFGLLIFFVVFGTPVFCPPGSSRHDDLVVKSDHQMLVNTITEQLNLALKEEGTSEDVRLFVLAVEMIVFLSLKPEGRAKDRYLNLFGKYLEDRPLGMFLRRMWKVGAWETVIEDYLTNKRDFEQFSETISKGEAYYVQQNNELLAPAYLGDLEATEQPLSSVSLTTSIERSHDELTCMLSKLLPSILDIPGVILELNTMVTDSNLVASVIMHHHQLHSMRKMVIKRTPIGKELSSQAITAASSGDVDTIDHLLEHLPNDQVFQYFSDGNLLCHAAANGRADLISHLVRRCGFRKEDSAGGLNKALVVAVESLQHDTASTLLNLGSDSNAILNVNTLTYVSNYGDQESIDLLGKALSHKSGAQEAKSFWNADSSRWPFHEDPEAAWFHPLFAAILGNNLQTFSALLGNGCDTGALACFDVGSGQEMLAPLHLAALLRPLHVALLLKFGADVEVRTQPSPGSSTCQSLTALHLACTARTSPSYWYPGVEARYESDDAQETDSSLTQAMKTAFRIVCVDMLVRGHGADVNAQDARGRTSLSHCTDYRGDEDRYPIAEHLVKKLRANVNIPDVQGLSCLHRVVLFNPDFRFIELLVDNGAHLDAQDQLGYTPLASAACHGRLKYCQHLLAAGANVTHKTRKCFDLLSITAGARQFEIMDMLFSHAESQGQLNTIMSHRDLDYDQTLAHRLLKSGDEKLHQYFFRLPEQSLRLEVNRKERLGLTFFHHAMFTGNLAIVSRLVDLGADINNKSDIKGITPLHIASGSKHQELIAFLLERGADADSRDDDGLTPNDYLAKARLYLNFWQNFIDSIDQMGSDLLG